MSNYMSPSLEDLAQMEYQDLYEIAMSDLLTRSVGVKIPAIPAKHPKFQ
jgi:hypothetical protein